MKARAAFWCSSEKINKNFKFLNNIRARVEAELWAIVCNDFKVKTWRGDGGGWRGEAEAPQNPNDISTCININKLES